MRMKDVKRYLDQLYENEELFGDSAYSFSLRDDYNLRSSGAVLSKSTTRTYYNILDEINYKYDINNRNVERNIKKLLIEFLKYKSQNKNVNVGNRERFVDTLVYYAHLLSGVKIKRPKKFHRELRKFIRSKYSSTLNQYNVSVSNSSYENVKIKMNITKYEDDTHIYRLSFIVDKYIKRKLTTRTRASVLGSVILYFIVNDMIRLPQIVIFKNLGIAVNYSKRILDNNYDYFDRVLRSLPKEDKKVLIDSIIGYFNDKYDKFEVNEEKINEFLNS